MKKQNQILFFIFILLALALPVFAVKPVTQISTENEVNLQIEYPKIEFVPYGINWNWNMHVFNYTNALMTNKTTDCDLHLYAYNGAELYYGMFSYLDHQFYLNISGSDLNIALPNQLSIVPYLIHCNSTNGDAGFVSSAFYITPSGNDNTKGEYIMLGLILIPLLFAFLLISIIKSLNETHDVLKIFLMLGSLIMFFLSLNFGLYGVANYMNYPQVQELIGNITYWVGWILFIIVTYFMIYIFKKLVHHSAQKEDEKFEY